MTQTYNYKNNYTTTSIVIFKTADKKFLKTSYIFYICKK